jgi:hypothetical protein
MTLYKIIESLKSASGSNAKQAILTEHKDNELFKEFMRVTYDPAISYFISKCPIRTHDFSEYAFSKGTIDALVFTLAGRDLTGGWAAKWLQNLVNSLNSEGQELLKLLINRSVGAGVGDTLVLKVFPKLFFVPAYMRCSLVNEKTLKPFMTGEMFALQKKADGQYCSLYTSRKAYTRAGNAYPDWLVSQLLTGQKSYMSLKRVILGEVLVCEKSSGNVLNRQVGNGLINSALKGADFSEFKDYEFFMECWDMLTEEEFEMGYSDTPYDRRFKDMTDIVEWEMENVLVIQTYFIDTMEEAYALNGGLMCEGFEGSVIKTLTHKWRSHTSPFNVKLKVVFEIDLEVEEIVEGSGKYVGMMGAVKLKSRCGKLRTDVGTGFSDQQRKDIFEFGLPKIVTIKANDIIGKRGSDTFSCFLPVFLEARLDKTVADTYDECVAQLNAAKGIV